MLLTFILFQLSHVTIAEHVRIPHVVEIHRYIVDDLVDAVSLIPFYGGRIMESKLYGFLSVLERAVVCLHTGLLRTSDLFALVERTQKQEGVFQVWEVHCTFPALRSFAFS